MSDSEILENNIPFILEYMNKTCYICFNCDVCFRTKDKLEQHIDVSCVKKYMNNTMDNNIIEELMESKYSMLLSKTSLLRHILRYNINSADEFQYLYKIYMAKILSLLDGIENEEKLEDVNRFECSMCNKCFSTSSNLTKHRKKCNVSPIKTKSQKIDIEIVERLIIKIQNDIRTNVDMSGISNPLQLFLYNFLSNNPSFGGLNIDRITIGKFVSELKDPKAYLYFSMSNNRYLNSFDSKVYIDHINMSMWSDIYNSNNPILVFIENLFTLNENCNIYVVNINKRELIIHFNVIDTGNNRLTNVLFRPTNSEFLLKEWIKTVYLINLNYLDIYLKTYCKLKNESKVLLRKIYRKELEDNYREIFATRQTYSLFLNSFLKTYEKFNHIADENFRKVVVDKTIYNGQLKMFNKFFDNLENESMSCSSNSDINQISDFIQNEVFMIEEDEDYEDNDETITNYSGNQSD